MKRAFLWLALAACAEPSVPVDADPPRGAVVTARKSGDGTGNLTSEPAGIDCDTACTDQVLTLPIDTTTMMLTADPKRDALFESWTCLLTRAGEPDPQIVTSTPDVVAFYEADPTDVAVECTARFRQLYTLLVIRSGDGNGDVVGALAAPGGGTRIDCGKKCTAGYFADEQETLTAVPGAGSSFAGWSFDCAGAIPEATVILDADKDCEARFELSGQ
jgi:hypothetical protein